MILQYAGPYISGLIGFFVGLHHSTLPTYICLSGLDISLVNNSVPRAPHDEYNWLVNTGNNWLKGTVFALSILI